MFVTSKSDQAIILYMPWQLSCHGICKIMAWSDDYIHNYSKKVFMSFQLWAHKLCDPGDCCNIGYPSETYPKPKSRESLFVYNLVLHQPIVLKFCTEHGSDCAICGANFQNGQAYKMDVIGKWNFVRFEFEMEFLTDIL